MSDTTERLIDGLVSDLEPVRPLPRLRAAFAGIVALWAGLIGALGARQLIATGGLTATVWLADRVYLSAFVALGVAALGGTVAALAAGIPGREGLERVALAASGSGLLVGVLACLAGLGAGPEGSQLAVAAGERMCFGESVLFSLLPAGVVLVFLLRGWVVHPGRAAALALLGSGALGASIVHFGCGFLQPGHVLLGHLSVPLVLALLGAYPLGLLLARLRG